MIREEGSLGSVLGTGTEQGCETLEARPTSLSSLS